MKKIFFALLLGSWPLIGWSQNDTIVNYWRDIAGTALTDTNTVVKTTVSQAIAHKADTMATKKKTGSGGELIAITGGGYNNARQYSQDDFGFVEMRLMIRLFNGLRIGPYGGYIQYSSRVSDPQAQLLGREGKVGLAFDSYGFITKTLSWYGWLNSSFGRSYDKYQQLPYKSNVYTNLLLFSGGFSLSDGLNGWFSHNQILFDYGKPLTNTIRATWNSQAIANEKAFNKKAYRLVLESSLKRFYVGRKSNLEPLLHLGYGHDYGNSQSYREYGLGLGFGFFKDWYRDIFKIKAYWRDKTPGPRINGEATLNITSLIKVINK